MDNVNGTGIQDMHDFTKPIIRKKLDKVVLRIGRNKIVEKDKEAKQLAQEIYDRAQDIEAKTIPVPISDLSPRANSEQN